MADKQWGNKERKCICQRLNGIKDRAIKIVDMYVKKD